MTRIAITGAAGRMGRILIEAVDAVEDAQVGAAIVLPSDPMVGVDAGAIAGLGKNLNVVAVTDVAAAVDSFDVLIDFTAPEATLAFAALAAQARAVHVIGTTGLSDADIAKLAPAARHAVIVRAGNMSLGVNLLMGLTKRVAAALDEAFDIEVVEANENMMRPQDVASSIIHCLGTDPNYLPVDLEIRPLRPKGK